MYRILIGTTSRWCGGAASQSVNWNELDIEMVAEAENGIEAMEQVLEERP